MSTIRLRVAAVNFEYGGVGPDGSDAPLIETLRVLARERPHVLLGQEFGVPQPSLRQMEHLWRTANELGMTPVLGPVPPGTRTALHTVIFVDTARTGWRITGQSPYPGAAGVPGAQGAEHAWCGVTLSIPGLARPLHCVSVHLPARSAAARLAQVEYASSLLAGKELVLLGGDLNCYPRGGPAISAAQLADLPGQLRVTRCRTGPDGTLEPDYAVDDVLNRAGLIDLAPHLPPECRTPPELAPTGRGGARVDRIYATQALADTATGYQHLTTGSDHLAPMVHLDLTTDHPTAPTVPIGAA